MLRSSFLFSWFYCLVCFFPWTSKSNLSNENIFLELDPILHDNFSFFLFRAIYNKSKWLRLGGKKWDKNRGRKRYASAWKIFPFQRDNQKVDFFPFNRIQNVWNFIAPMAIRISKWDSDIQQKFCFYSLTSQGNKKNSSELKSKTCFTWKSRPGGIVSLVNSILMSPSGQQGQKILFIVIIWISFSLGFCSVLLFFLRPLSATREIAPLHAI